jgi:hypothetical protein
MNGSSPVVNPSQETEQGARLPGPKTGAGNGLTPPPVIQSPLDASGAKDIISAAGLGAQRNLNSNQFKMPELPGESAEGAEGAGELGEPADLAPLALA